MTGPHPSHKTRSSDASSFDEICTLCGATDSTGSWGKLAEPCPKAEAEQPAKPHIREPTEEGKYPGDTFYGDDQNTTSPTHVWHQYEDYPPRWLNLQTDTFLDMNPPQAEPGAEAKPKEDSRCWPLLGYAPGSYYGKSRISGTQFMGAKRSWMTLEEAVAEANKIMGDQRDKIATLESKIDTIKQTHREEIDALRYTIQFMAKSLKAQEIANAVASL